MAKFLVTRTSHLGDDGAQPCEEAQRETYLQTQRVSVLSPEEMSKYHEDIAEWRCWWYNEGINHRVEDGCITREIERLGWFIILATLEELLKFQRKYPRLVLKPQRDQLGNIIVGSLPVIEIYDEPRE